MNQHKTKVIAIRITQDQYEELNWLSEIEDMNVGNLVRSTVLDRYKFEMVVAREALNKERKKAEAKAKRLAKKEAANGL